MSQQARSWNFNFNQFIIKFQKEVNRPLPSNLIIKLIIVIKSADISRTLSKGLPGCGLSESFSSAESHFLSPSGFGAVSYTACLSAQGAHVLRFAHLSRRAQVCVGEPRGMQQKKQPDRGKGAMPGRAKRAPGAC